MCGIAGVFLLDRGRASEESLRAMASCLAHRGPDEEGCVAFGHVGLAHRRLKVIDLSRNAAQPMCDEEKRCWLVFNGEIYNFRELRKELERHFHFFSDSDSEVVLRLFQRDRERAWGLLNGMFALALYDAQTEELFLARDHAGIKPLFVYQDVEKIVFASELKAILGSGLLHPEIDQASLALYLQYGYFPGTHTPFRNVWKILPGHCASVRAGRLEQRQYWKLDEFLSGAGAPPSRRADRLDELLMEAVARQLVSDVPLGAFLSGGIDSSLIVALMKKASCDPVRTFTVGFARMGYYDERPAAARIARLFGAEHHEFTVDTGIADWMPRLACHLDEPFADSSAIPTFCLAELARKHVTVALSGTGGDEIFGGYRKYMAAHWASAYTALPDSLREALKRASSILPDSRRSLWGERSLLLKRFLAINPDAGAVGQFNWLFTPDEIRAMLGVSPAPLLLRQPSSTIAEDLMLFDFDFYLPDDLLVKEDRSTMAFGLEARVPYLDRKVVEFMAGLPIGQKVSGRSTKRLFRQVARRHLPEWVLRRPKHGFGSPVAEWLREELRDFAVDVLLAPDAMTGGAAVRRMLDRHQRGAADFNRQLWALLMLELWRKNNR